MTQDVSEIEAKFQGTPPNIFNRTANVVDSFFAKHFYRIGLFVGTRPCTTIGMALLFSLLCMAGFSQLTSESRSDKLWIPQDTPAQADMATYMSYFPPTGRMQTIIFEAKSGNALDKKMLTATMAAHTEVEAIKSGDDTLRTICIPKPNDGHPCFINSILMLWKFDAAVLAADSDPIATINAAGKSKEDLNRLLGEPVYDSNGKLVSAKALGFSYFLQNNRVRQGGGYEDKRGKNWEEKFLKVFKCDSPKCNDDGDCVCDYPAADFNTYVLAQRSWSDVFGKIIRGDIGMINAAFAIMIIYCVLNLGGICHKIKSRSLLALGCIATIVLAGAAGYGLSMWCQIMYSPQMSVMPFVLLGIGVDDSFVIMNALDGVSSALAVPERIATALSHAGVSIFLTSATDFVAFAISVSCALPALSSFCFYAAASILFLFVFQITVFAAFATFDARRVSAGMIDCCPCICRKGCPCCKTVPLDEAVAEDGTDKNQLCCKGAPSKGGAFGTLLEKWLGPILVKPPVAAAVVVFALGLCGLCAWQTSQLKVEEAQPKFVPDDSYVRLALNKQDRYFGLLGDKFAIVTEGGDYFASQAALTSISTRLDKLGFVKPASISSDSFESWAEHYQAALKAGSVANVKADANGVAQNKNEYYAGLKAWLDDKGARYAKDIKWVDAKDPQQGIRATRINAELKPFNNLVDGMVVVDDKRAVEVMDGLRDAVKSWSDMPGGKAFPYARKFLSWEVFRIIKKEVFMSLGLCLGAVYVLTTIIIAHPGTSGLVFLCVVMVIVDILGFMNIWGLSIDNVSVIQLVIAVGLSVDYSAHIGHCFMTKQGTRAERVVATLGDVGTAVLNGGVSTFLAVMLLALSKSYVFRVMFQTFFLTVTFGLFHGLIVLPAMLSFIGPAAYNGRVALTNDPSAEKLGKPAPV